MAMKLKPVHVLVGLGLYLVGGSYVEAKEGIDLPFIGNESGPSKKSDDTGTSRVAGALAIDRCSEKEITYTGGEDVQNATDLAHKIKVIGPDGQEIDLGSNLGAEWLMIQQVTVDNGLDPSRTIQAGVDYTARKQCTMRDA